MCIITAGVGGRIDLFTRKFGLWEELCDYYWTFQLGDESKKTKASRRKGIWERPFQKIRNRPSV